MHKLLRSAALAGIVLVFLSLSIEEIRSADFWWQLRTGQWVVEHHQLPRQDELTYTVRGHEWIETRWLFFVLTYLGFSVGGPALLVLGQTLVLALSFLVLIWPRRRVVATVPGALVLLLGVWSASERFIVRPEIATFLLLSLELVLLDGARRGRYARAVWALPFVQIAWNNVHTLFVLGPIVAWSFVAGDLLQRLPPARRSPGPAGPAAASRRLFGVAAAITLACLVTPYGLRGALLPALLFREMHGGSVLGRRIEELRSPFALDSWSWDLWAAALLFCASGLTFLLNRKRTDLARLLIWASVVYLSAQSVRNAALLGFVGAWAALGNLADAREEQAGRTRPLPAWAPGVAWALLAALGLGGAWAVVAGRVHERRFGLGVDPGYQPQAAVDFLLQSGARPQLFHAMSDGSYLDWAAAGRFPVFIDGRNEVFGEPFIAEYLAVAEGSRSWEVFADRFGINSVMIHREELARLVEPVRQSPRWVLVHLDARELVFVRDIPAHAELIRRFRIDPRAPWTPRGPEPDETLAGWRRFLGAAGRPWYSLGMARSFLVLGGIDAAASYLERAHREFPDDRETRLVLAQVYRTRGRGPDASRLLAGLDPAPEEASRMDELLASLLSSEGRPAEALEPLRRALVSRPGDATLQGKLARAYFEARDYAHAAEVYREAVRLAPASATYWTELGHALAQAGDATGAVAAYENALRRDPSRYQVQYNLGVLLARNGDLAAAVKRFRLALQSNPDYEPARRALDDATDAAGTK